MADMAENVAVVLKRGRGRPRKIDKAITDPDPSQTHSLTIDRSASATKTTKAGTSVLPTSSPVASNKPERLSAVVLSPTSSNKGNGSCESCMADNVRVFKFGKLKVCKICEELMRTMTGSSRRQAAAQPTSPPISRPRSSTSTTQPDASSSPKRDQVRTPANSTHAEGNRNRPDDVSPITSVVSRSECDPSISSTSPTFQIVLPGGRPPSSILPKNGEVIKKQSYKPNVKDVAPDPTPEAQQKLESIKPHPQLSTENSSSTPMAGKKRGRKPRPLYPIINRPVITTSSAPEAIPSAPVVVFKSKSATYVETSVTATAIIDTNQLTDVEASSTSTSDGSKFQTTGAFLTRTASKLLGGQKVIGLDSNIHGYAHGRLVKVQNLDKTWHYGAMVGLDRGKIKVHFDGWGPEWDEWIASDSRRLKILDADEIAIRNSLLLPSPPSLPAPPLPKATQDVANDSTIEKATLQQPLNGLPATVQTLPSPLAATCPTGDVLPVKTTLIKESVPIKRKLPPSMDDVASGLMVVDPDLPRVHEKVVKKTKTSSTKNSSEISLFSSTSICPPKQKKTKLTKVDSTLSSSLSSDIQGIAEVQPVPILPKSSIFNCIDLTLQSSQAAPTVASAENSFNLASNTVNPNTVPADSVSQPPKLIAIAPKGPPMGIFSTTNDVTGVTIDKPPKLTLAQARQLLVGVEVGTKVQAQDKCGQWRAATVVQIKARRVLIQFNECPGWPEEWLIADSKRLVLPKQPLAESQGMIQISPKHISKRATAKAATLKRRDSAWSPPIDIEALSPKSHPTTSRTSSSSSLSSAQSFFSSPSTLEILSSSSDLSEPTSIVSLPDDLSSRVETKVEDIPPPEPTPRPPHTLGNPILLDLPPYEIVAFEFEDQEKEILRIIYQVLDTGLIKNTVIEYPPKEYIPPMRVSKKKKRTADDINGEGTVDGAEGVQEGEEGDDDESEKTTSKRSNIKTIERFEALMEARLERASHRPSIFSAKKTPSPIKKKDPEILRKIREEAVKNMCNIPILHFVRQVIYKESDRIEALNNSFERQKQKFARSMAKRVSIGNRLKTKRTLGPLSRRIFGLSNPDLTGITFNEAGYIESTTVPKPALVPSPEALKKLMKMKKKKERLKKKKAMENPNVDLLQDDNVDDTFQNLRSLTRDNKKKKRPLKEDHITFLRRTMVPGTRIKSRDRQLEWLTAVIRDVKNSRVLVHYEGFAEFFNEWIDINSERLKFDPTLEQHPVPLEGIVPPGAKNIGVATPLPQAEATGTSTTIAEAKEATAENDEAEPNFEAISDNVQHEEGGKEVHCVQCQVKISQFRIYCMYCEVESKVEESERKPFNICLWCFSNAYPEYHDHPRSSFATKVIVGPRGVRPVKGGIITRFEKDLMDLDYKEPERPDTALVPDLHLMGLEGDQRFTYLDQWKDRKVCAFCNDDGTTKDHFIGPQPFLMASTNKYGDTKKRSFWAHDACARHSPEVIQAKDGSWYNVTMAMRRGRSVKCTVCREKGATIGCFDPKCGRSFHVPCTNKPMSHFEDGVIFWCPQHERALMQKDAYDDTFSCDRCSKILGVNPWHTCSKCSEDYFHTFDLCRECFSKDDISHEHDKEDFNITSLELMYKEQLEKEAAIAQAIDSEEYAPAKKKIPSYKPKMRGLSRLVCSYCWSGTSAKWRKGYNGVLMCEDCFLAGPVNDTPMQPPMGMDPMSDVGAGSIPLSSAAMLAAQDAYIRGVGTYATSAEDYSHSPYLTRTAVSAVRFDHSSSQAVYLDSYGPAENQLFSLPIDTTYYDIPGRAPRWATHSGTDYHGTWLPQTVRRAVTKFTNPNDKILSNFLGRGTDAIECFLLGRCCTAVDINPAAITLSIRNCSFAIPQDGSIKAEHRPIILQGDSRRLSGPLFESESFDHVLSHPPYKDCVAYSTHIDGDLSRFGNSLEFQREMRSVVRETYRLLKPGRRCTLGIGDNREHCFYIPVSFQLIRQYINEGFELEELIVKRQRYCAMFGLGTYLCVQFDFLCFTHEFIATLRKIPKEEIDTMIIEPDYSILDDVRIISTVRAIPSCPVERKSVVMGSVWTFKPTEEYDFPTLCVSRMVERFGRNDANWEEYKLNFKIDNPEETKADAWTEQVVEILPPEEDDLVSYERDRLQQIQENNRMLLALGLITDLSETSDDLGHQSKISKEESFYPPPAETTLRLVAHIPCTVLKSHQITAYRTAVMHLAKEALEKLPVTGVFIVGAQDIRTESGKLYPLGMLIMEDIIRAVGEEYMKLKELIEAVPDGYQKDRRKITSWAEFKEEPRSPGDNIPTHHLPVVHACYLVFTKVKEIEHCQPVAKKRDGETTIAGTNGQGKQMVFRFDRPGQKMSISRRTRNSTLTSSIIRKTLAPSQISIALLLPRPEDSDVPNNTIISNIGHIDPTIDDEEDPIDTLLLSPSNHSKQTMSCDDLFMHMAWDYIDRSSKEQELATIAHDDLTHDEVCLLRDVLEDKSGRKPLEVPCGKTTMEQALKAVLNLYELQSQRPNNPNVIKFNVAEKIRGMID
ncbi:hypothetical protein FBU30_008125 [Linnemannia zychae]|nr:hypothetical protein FBU30_008125 [Linnemannia zychae]